MKEAVTLSAAEEQLMRHLWKHKQAFLKDLISAYPEPKPAPTTLATLLKRMSDKGYVGFEDVGNARLYHPLVKKSDYSSYHIHKMIHNFFGSSASQFASFFTTETGLSKEELKELRKIIDKQIEKKKK